MPGTPVSTTRNPTRSGPFAHWPNVFETLNHLFGFAPQTEGFNSVDLEALHVKRGLVSAGNRRGHVPAKYILVLAIQQRLVQRSQNTD